MVQQALNRDGSRYPMRPSAKVIAFPVRTGWGAPNSTSFVAVPRVERPRLPKFTPWLLLLAPVIIIGSLVSFLAVVGVFLVWLIIVCLLVIGAFLFARRLFRRSAARGSDGYRP